MKAKTTTTKTTTTKAVAKTATKTATKAVVKAPEPKKEVIQTYNHHLIGISLWKQKWLNQITHLSGTLAINNEYQVHMWSLVFRKIFKDNSIMDVTIPLVIYNYAQVVTSVTVDFEGKDMIKMSEITKELAMAKAKQLLIKLPNEFKANFNEVILTPYMTLHRHP